MAVNIRQLFPLQQAKVRRSQLARYLSLDGGRYLIAAAVILSLMSLISLGQTGRLATQGYELAQMQTERTQLLRQRSALQLQLSEAASLLKIDQRATALLSLGTRSRRSAWRRCGATPARLLTAPSRAGGRSRVRHALGRARGRSARGR